MEIRFIGQGYNRETGISVANELIEALNDDSFNSFKCLVAFASHTGVSGLQEQIVNSKNHIETFKVIVGIDQFGTSKEALEALIEWDVDTFVFYTTQGIIFHPKIYIFEGDNMVRVIIGSNNLTQTGLAQNIEGAIQITYNKNEDDIDLVNQIIDYYNPLLTGDSPYLRPLTPELIEQLVATGKVKDEANRRAQYVKEEVVEPDDNDGQNGAPLITDIFGRIPMQGLPEGFSPIRRPRRAIPVTPSASTESTVTETNDTEEVVEAEIVYGDLVWRKSNLPGSDVQYAAPGTNPTGGIRLVQAGFNVYGAIIDQTTYFRDTVFNGENWIEVGQNPFREMAEVRFRIIINGVDKGIFTLGVRHKPAGEAGQHNYTSLISWGDASEIIQETDLRQLTFELYNPSGEDDPYIISIN